LRADLTDRVVIRREADGRWSVEYPDQLSRRAAEEPQHPISVAPDDVVFELPVYPPG
jgi:hypothetical protein